MVTSDNISKKKNADARGKNCNIKFLLSLEHYSIPYSILSRLRSHANCSCVVPDLANLTPGTSSPSKSGFSGYCVQDLLKSPFRLDEYTPDRRVLLFTLGCGKAILLTISGLCDRVGIYGWRKRCLYALILLLAVVIVVNLAVTIWIMKVLRFNASGMNGLHVTKHGIKIDGVSEFTQHVYVDKIKSNGNKDLFIQSDGRILFNALKPDGKLATQMFMGLNSTTAVCDRFELQNKEGNILLATDGSTVSMNISKLDVIDDAGSTFSGSLQTNLVKPFRNKPLRLESITRNIHLDAGQDVNIRSKAGDVTFDVLQDISLKAESGIIDVHGQNLYIRSLPASNGHGPKHYQLCACIGSGKLYLAKSGVDCRASRRMCQK